MVRQMDMSYSYKPVLIKAVMKNADGKGRIKLCDIVAYFREFFEDMQMLHHTKTLGIIEVEPTVWKALTDEEKSEISDICDKKLEEYFNRFTR